MKYKIGFTVMSLSEFTNHSYFNWFFFLQQGRGIFGNFEKSKLNPIPNKNDDSGVSCKQWQILINLLLPKVINMKLLPVISLHYPANR